MYGDMNCFKPSQVRKMSKLVDKVIIVAASAALAFTAIGPASATTWVVTNVLIVSNEGGFGASSFHNATGSETSGGILANISGSGLLGSYNDVTGALSVSATVTQNSNVFSMSLASTGPLQFNGAGYLAAHNTLDLTFDDDSNETAGTILSGTTTQMGFKLGDVCCSGPTNPNSFKQPGGDADERWITLWGADNFNTATGTYDSGSESTLGLDLRIRLEKTTTTVEVPAPAAHVILGLGLIGPAYMRRRRNV